MWEVLNPDVFIWSVTPHPEEAIEAAYKICYDKPFFAGREEQQKFITARIKQGHLSALEFAFAQFEITCSRAASHQLVRHRIASYAQQSQRRVKVKDYVIWPPSFNTLNNKDILAITDLIEANYAWYEDLINKGIPKEDARSILPSMYTTKIMVGMNFRALRHFFKLRCNEHAQWEIRDIALQMLYDIYSYAPSVFGDLYEKYCNQEDIELWTEWD